MLKKGLKFYTFSLSLSLVWSFTVGMVVGWFVTEGGFQKAAVAVSAVSFVLLLGATYVYVITWVEKDIVKKTDILKFLTPYLIVFALFIVFFIPVLLHFVNGRLGYYLNFILPSHYIGGMMLGIKSGSYTPMFLIDVICTFIHIAETSFLLFRAAKRNKKVAE